MEYTVAKVAQVSGVSKRTLRYYDEIGLLRPTRIATSGYRIYGRQELDTLQQILFYRTLDFTLTEIRQILQNPQFDKLQALYDHEQALVKKREEIEALIANVRQTIQAEEGAYQMTDTEKFAAFKQQKIAENEKKYGKEIRGKYGEQVVDQANERLMSKTDSAFVEMQSLEDKLFIELTNFAKQPILPSNLAYQIFAIHKKWLMCSWTKYTAAAHNGLGQMYVADPRFMAYYDTRGGKGTARHLHDVILYYTN